MARDSLLPNASSHEYPTVSTEIPQMMQPLRHSEKIDCAKKSCDHVQDGSAIPVHTINIAHSQARRFF